MARLSASAGGDGGFDMNAAVVKLLALAANKRATRPEPRENAGGLFRAGAFTLSRLNDWSEPSPAHIAADRALKDFQDELVAIGGVDLPLEVYDEAAERHGYRSVMGVSASWDGRHHWYH